MYSAIINLCHEDLERLKRQYEIAKSYGDVFYIHGWTKEQNASRPILCKRRVIQVKKGDGKIWFVPYSERALNPNEVEKYEIMTLENGLPICYYVNPGQYKSKAKILDKFKDKRSIDKMEANFENQTLLSEHSLRDKKIVILDSPSLQTTQYVFNTNLYNKPNAIHVPNLDPDFKNKARSKKNAHFLDSPCVKIHNGMTMYEWIRDNSDGEYLWDVAFDYCCTFNGNTLVKPESDIELMFIRRLIPKHNGVLWFTFSLRRGGTTFEKLKRHLKAFLKKAARENGYNYIECINSKQYGTMACFFYVTKRHKHCQHYVLKSHAIESKIIKSDEHESKVYKHSKPRAKRPLVPRKQLTKSELEQLYIEQEKHKKRTKTRRQCSERQERIKRRKRENDSDNECKVNIDEMSSDEESDDESNEENDEENDEESEESDENDEYV